LYGGDQVGARSTQAHNHNSLRRRARGSSLSVVVVDPISVPCWRRGEESSVAGASSEMKVVAVAAAPAASTRGPRRSRAGGTAALLLLAPAVPPLRGGRAQVRRFFCWRKVRVPFYAARAGPGSVIHALFSSSCLCCPRPRRRRRQARGDERSSPRDPTAAAAALEEAVALCRYTHKSARDGREPKKV
jgi:hypothetical protein